MSTKFHPSSPGTPSIRLHSMKLMLLLLFVILFAQPGVTILGAEEGSSVEKDETLNWSFTPDPALPNVLILGDSISIGYTLQVRELLRGKANVYRPMKGNSGKVMNCGGTRKGIKGIDGWLKGKEWAVIHFNWGLHDLKHMKPPEMKKLSNDPNDPVEATPKVYHRNLDILTTKIKATGARVVFATTTPVVSGTLNPLRDPATPARYNKVASKLMQTHGVRMNDLYSFCEPHLDVWQQPKNVHFNAEGSAALAKQVASVITEELDLVEAKVGRKSREPVSQKKTGAYLKTGGERKLDVVSRKP